VTVVSRVVVRRGATFALAALLLAACGTGSDETAGGRATAPAELPRSSAPRVLPTTAPPVYEPLPIPIVIPLDSYANEPVVEYGSIHIPKIGLDHKLYHGVTLHNIDLGPSHWPGTATPGQRGNAVIAGHRVTHSRPFLRVEELVAGDEVVFRVDGTRSTYRVTDSFVVAPQDTWIADQSKASTATLYACHPPGSETQRYVVQLALVSTGAA
jgi:sortase A